jgi:hypothetical protein
MPASAAARKNSSKYLVRAAMASVIRRMPSFGSSSMSAGSSSPLASRVKNSTPTARTSGSANGSSISGSSLFDATALAAATIVAVAPTLLARSHVSSSVRAMLNPFDPTDAVTPDT